MIKRKIIKITYCAACPWNMCNEFGERWCAITGNDLQAHEGENWFPEWCTLEDEITDKRK